MEQIRESEKDPHPSAQLIFDEGAKHKWKEDKLFNEWYNRTSTSKQTNKNEPWPESHILYKINSKLIKDINIKCKTVNLSLKQEKHPWNIEPGKVFLDLTPKGWFIKEKSDKLDFIKIKKNLCSAKDTQHVMWDFDKNTLNTF